MRHHLHLGHLPGDPGGVGRAGIGDGFQAGKEQFRARIFVVDREQAAIAALQREIAHEIVIVAELLRLPRAGLRHRIKGQGIGHDRVAPADEDIGIVAFGNVVVAIDTGCHLLETESGFAAFRCLRLRGFGGHETCGHEAGGQGRSEHGAREQAAHEVAAIHALGDDVADGRARGGVGLVVLVVIHAGDGFQHRALICVHGAPPCFLTAKHAFSGLANLHDGRMDGRVSGMARR